MDYELPQEAIKIIKSIEKDVGGRNALETLLVCAGGKPGDKISFLASPKKIRKFGNYLSKLKEIVPYLDFVSNGLGEIIYFNKNLATREVAEEVAHIFEKNLEGSDIVGVFYGYPICCIDAFINDRANGFFPATEHLWCGPDCRKSKTIQQNNYRIVRKYAPDLEKYLTPGFNLTRFYKF